MGGNVVVMVSSLTMSDRVRKLYRCGSGVSLVLKVVVEQVFWWFARGC